MTEPASAATEASSSFRPRYFNPGKQQGAVSHSDGSVVLRLTKGTTYIYSEAIILAVNVAIATGRPLLLAGNPGTGKTTLAANVAGVLGWKFYPKVISSRTKASDLMWTFDALHRLSDAQASAQDGSASLRPRAAYLEPQVLWWAFDPASAARRGAVGDTTGVRAAVDPQAGTRSDRAIVLLDEIDKAEPDVPNDLLEALDAERFSVDALDPPLAVIGDRRRVLLMITTNGEREMPAAFIRRCVVLKLDPPSEDQLVRIADDRFGGRAHLHRPMAQRLILLRAAAERMGLREPSTAEYLDALAACRDLEIDLNSPEWALLEQSLLWKRDQQVPSASSPATGPP